MQEDTQDFSMSGSVSEVPRNAHRLGRSKDVVSERKTKKASKDMGIRPRSFYDDPDYDAIDEISFSSSNLKAPALPGYEQRWISMNKEKGAHLLRMLSQGGWTIRDPKTVPYTAGLNTQKWGEYDAIVAGGELILCCMRKDIFEKYQARKHREQYVKTEDVMNLGRDLYGQANSLKSQHATVYRPSIDVQR